MTAMVVRAAKLAPASGELTFKDAALIDRWAREDVLTVVKDGIVHGYSDGTFRPLAYATRAEAVNVIVGALTIGRSSAAGSSAGATRRCCDPARKKLHLRLLSRLA